MWYHCASCGFEQMYLTRPQICRSCRKAGTMAEGRALVGGFQIGSDARWIDPPGIVGEETGKVTPKNQIDYFAGLLGGPYEKFIKSHTTYLERFANFWLPACDQFAWLNPYTGNQHNRTMFTHLVISAVAARLRAVNGTLPRLVEPFVGSGQIFLNACAHGPEFNRGQPLFSAVVGGDLNPYVIAGHSLMCTMGNAFVAGYKAFAEELDGHVGGDQPDARYQQLRYWTDTNGLQAATGGSRDARRYAAFAYIYLVNRCKRSSPLNSLGGVNANMDEEKVTRLASIRTTETAALTACVGVLQSLPCSFSRTDFTNTCAEALPTDLVILDCPFPKFSYKMPEKLPEPGVKPSLQSLQNAGTYGTGDDGSSLQTKIVDQIERLTAQGTTVLVCNFANPELILAYRYRIATRNGEDGKRSFVFTYKSPSTNSQAYQLAIIPGHGMDLDLTMLEISKIWADWGGFG